jgi:hypothetical protein
VFDLGSFVMNHGSLMSDGTRSCHVQIYDLTYHMTYHTDSPWGAYHDILRRAELGVQLKQTIRISSLNPFHVPRLFSARGGVLAIVEVLRK